MNALMEQFIQETRELMEDAAQGLLTLEKTPQDPDALGRVFRALHSTKGASGLFDLDPMTNMIHLAEDLLDRARDDQVVLTPEHVDVLLDVLDQVSHWIDALETDESLPADAEARSRELQERLQDGPSGDAAWGAELPQAESASAQAAVDWLETVPDRDRRALVAAALAENRDLLAISYTPEPGCFFVGDDPILTVRDYRDLHWLDVRGPEQWETDEAFDPFSCQLEFRILALGSADEATAHFDYVSEQVRIESLSTDSLAFVAGQRGAESLCEPFTEQLPGWLADDRMDDLDRAATRLQDMLSPDLLESSAVGWLRLAVAHERRDWLQHFAAILQPDLTTDASVPAAAVAPMAADGGRTVPKADAALVPATEEEPAGTDPVLLLSNQGERAAELVAALQQAQQQMLNLPAESGVWPQRVRSAIRVIACCLRAMDDRPALEALPELEQRLLEARSGKPLTAFLQQADNPARPAEAAPSGDDDTDDAPGSAAAAVMPRTKSFRVDAANVDLLGDLVGELVVAKNSFPYLAQRAEHDFGVRELARLLKEQFSVISRIAQDMQGAVMNIQMLPVQQVFQRFPRLVRDLARRLGKDVELTLSGEQTEADKTVLEVLAEPLTHMVRNSLDHGLETPEERAAAGKPATGTLALRARHEGEQVVVELEDDGRGLDLDAIRRKAYQRGLISEQDLESMPDQEAMQLIFAPGFSTREAVSETSGRGVGMDVVRSTVVQHGGQVTLDSTAGQGTRVRLAMPMTMAVSYVMGVEANGQLFGVSMDNVVETVRVPTSSIQQVKQQEAIVLRDKTIPLRRLHTLLRLDAADGNERQQAIDAMYDTPQTAILVVRHQGEHVGLVVDDFQEGLDVIVKPLDGVLTAIRAYAGTALLGDGRVLLVLNLKELL